MNRRQLPLIALLALPQLGRAQSNPAQVKIAILKELVDAIGAAGSAMAKLTEGFTALAVASKDSYEYVAAQRERARLLDISRRTAALIAMPNMIVVETIDEYLRYPKSQGRWIAVVVRLDETLTTVLKLLTDVQNENGSFVSQPSYLQLQQTLSERVRLLSRLATLSAPESPEELALLREANERYKKLISNAQVALGQLNEYIARRK